MLITAMAMAMALAMSGAGQSTGSGEPNECDTPGACRRVDDLPVIRGHSMTNLHIGTDLPWGGQNNVQLATGESVVVRLDGATPVVESSTRAARVVDNDSAAAAAREIGSAGQAAMGANTRPAAARRASSASPADRLRITLRQAPNSQDSLLVIENGYGRAIDYKARMQVLGHNGEQETDVCQVRAGAEVTEHWPSAVFLINLDHFTFVDLAADAAPTCD